MECATGRDRRRLRRQQRARNRGVPTALVAAAMAAMILGLPVHAVADAGGGSLRIGTFNTRLVSPVFDASLADDPPDADRARAIADAVCGSSFGYDVLAFNEVWDDDLRAILRDRISSPACAQRLEHYVSLVYEPASVVDFEEDSGLMLFSRLPLAELIPPRDAARPPLVVETSDPAFRRRVEFAPFEHCSGIDCLATKGAGLVRLHDAGRGTYVNVVFTHLQAGGGSPEAARGVRSHQLRTIKALIERRPAEDRRQELFFVLGDLNIDGNRASERPEWRRYFSPEGADLGGIFGGELFDTWDRTTAEEDRGLTSGDSRLDYILMGAQPARCVQHLQLDFAELSDHLGVRADVNHPAPHCSPRTARDVVAEWGEREPADGWNGRWYDGRLARSGSMQWLRFDRPGTYSFAVEGPPDVRSEVYESRSLTSPIAASRETASTTSHAKIRTYSVPEAPFYVRVFRAARDAPAADYRVFVRRHGCTSRGDACILEPNQAIVADVPRDRPLGTTDTAWYEVATDRADSGKAQRLEFRAPRRGTAGALTVALRDRDGTVLQTSTGAAPDPILREEVGPARYYLTVRRTPVGGVFPGFSVGWRTTLAALHGLRDAPLELVAIDETGWDWTGSDEVRTEVFIDGEPEPRHTFDYRHVDSGEHLPLRMPPLRFVDNVTLVVGEGDVVGSGRRKVVLRLRPSEFRRLHAQERFPLGDGIKDGEYALNYNLSRRVAWAR